jgi:hypothetical protein
MIFPQITHIPCDLNQQHKRQVAARERLARAIKRRRRGLRDDLPTAAVHSDAEDVEHSLRF